MPIRDTRKFPQAKRQPRFKPFHRRKAQKILLPPGKHFPATGDRRLEALGRTKLVLLTVDPYLIHAYWTLSPRTIATARLQLAKDSRHPEAVLRFHDIARLSDGSSDTRSSFDVPVELDARNWYVHLWASGKSYCADLGLRTEGGGFVPIVRSNLAETPRAEISNGEKESFMLVKGNYDHIEQIQNTAGWPGKEEPADDRTSDLGGLISKDSFAIVPRGNPNVDIAEMSERAFIGGSTAALGVPGSGRTGK